MSTPLEDALRECVREICDRIANDPQGAVTEWPGERVWKRGPDGNFRPQPRKRFFLREHPELNEFESFRRCADLAKTDPIVAPQIDKLVGTALSRMRVDMGSIVRSLLYAMISKDGHFQFEEGLFQEHWEIIGRELTATTFPGVTIAPLPHLVAPFPLTLSQDLSIDRLTEEEFNYCAQVGILRPQSENFPLIDGKAAVGARITWSLKKIIGEVSPKPEMEGFGRRDPRSSSTFVDDIITALRLFKEGTISCHGELTTPGELLNGLSLHYRLRPMQPWDSCQYELSHPDVAGLQSLWRTLASGVLEKKAFVSASLRRFDMASDRERLEDRIVDLMIAAESLFLHDAGPARERGEMRYRLAVRAAGYVEFALYNQRQVYDLLREAYDVRSAVVHGGSIRHTKLPDKPDANLGEFTLAVEEVMRLGIKKALVDPDIEKPGFWDGRLFPEGNSAS